MDKHVAEVREAFELGVELAAQELRDRPPTLHEWICSPLHKGQIQILWSNETHFFCKNARGENINVPKQGCYRLLVAMRIATSTLNEDMLLPSIDLSSILK